MSESQAPVEAARAAVNRLLTASETLAAIGLALAQHAGDVELPQSFSDGVNAVNEAVLGDLATLSPAQARPLGSLARALLTQAAAFAAQPQEPAAWAVTDPIVLQALGQGSAALALPVGELMAERYPDLAERLAGPGATILDVGTGVGALAAAFAFLYPTASVVGIDIWAPALELARSNTARSELADRVEIRQQNVTDLDENGVFDLVWFAGPFIPGSILDASLERVVAATRQGGAVVYGTFTGTDPLSSALADLRILRSGGPVLSDDEIGAHLQHAGLTQIETATANIGMTARLVCGRRP